MLWTKVASALEGLSLIYIVKYNCNLFATIYVQAMIIADIQENKRRNFFEQKKVNDSVLVVVEDSSHATNCV